MKTQQTVYKCDNCGKEEVLVEGEIICKISSPISYWYVVKKEVYDSTLVKQERYFCSQNCLKEFNY